MKDFLKVAWINDSHKFYWKEKIQSFQSLYNKLEFESIGVTRQAAIITVDPFDLPEISKQVADRGWWLHVLSAIPAHIQYSNAARQPDKKEQIIYRVLVSIKHFTSYEDDYTLGRYLGYPFCCIHDFGDWWGHMEDHTPRLYATERRPSLSSTLFRQLGVRFVRHLPCSVACLDSARIAEHILNDIVHAEPSTGLAIKNFVLQEAKYSRLHGVAEVITPIVKFAYNTDYTKTKEAFELQGNTMVRFNEREYKDNGFSSMQAQDRAHDPIILNFLYLMKDSKNPNPKVIDYGCGNGVLLEKLQILYPNIIVYGVDLNDTALKNAEQRLPVGNFQVGNLFTKSFSGSFDITMVSVKRLEENPKLCNLFVDYLKNHSTFTIFYDYDNGDPVEEQLKRYYLGEIRVCHSYKNNSCEAVSVRW